MPKSVKKPKTTTLPRRHPAAKWDDSVYVRAHELARLGQSDQEIAKTLGVDVGIFRGWLAKRPALRDAVDRGRGSGGGGEKFFDYVHKRLPSDLKILWAKLEAHADADSPAEMVEEVFGDHHRRYRAHSPTRTRQRMWVHAYVRCGFIASEACRCVNVGHRDLEDWVMTDRGFRRLLEELNGSVKDDFFEGAVVDLVARREPAAVIFAAKSKLRHRGYGTDKNVNVNHNLSGSIGQTVVTVDLGSVPLDKLSADEVRGVFDRIQREKETRLPPKEVKDAD